MDVSDHVQSAGRAVLDMIQREWEPLSHIELEQRLDQAVEEILEADLIANVRAQPTFFLQFVQEQAQTETQFISAEPAIPARNHPAEVETPDDQETVDTVESHVVKYISDVLQNSKSHYNRARMTGRSRLSLSHSVLLSLTLLSERITYRSVSTRFRLEKGNIFRIFFSFCERVNMLEDEQIRWPAGKEAEEVLFPFSSLLGKTEGLGDTSVPKVLGVLGHTRIPLRLPMGKYDVDSAEPEVKRIKEEAHPDSWLNLELVCDCNGRFLHCRISKGSDTDRGRSLRDKLQQHPEMMPPDFCLVARAGYPLTTQILTPYMVSHGPRENLYNKTLEVHFSILDQSIATLKARFQRLRYLDMGSYERARAVVLTACILHNVFLDMGQVVKRELKEEEGRAQEEEGDVDEDGVRRREAISDFLYKDLNSDSASHGDNN